MAKKKKIIIPELLKYKKKTIQHNDVEQKSCQKFIEQKSGQKLQKFTFILQ